MESETNPPRPQKLWEGQLVDIDDDAYEAWVANGCPTELPPKTDTVEE